ncbi:hypothetical protein A9Q81_11170 [Gammaproteobacteria bacterium 42_54_T18]|nr:hypothetical protein A9Q81_11170 [Gammaproteobacteria bacterium 42_54_T18]
MKDTLYLQLKDEALQSLLEGQHLTSIESADDEGLTSDDQEGFDTDDSEHVVSEAQVQWLLAPDGVVNADAATGSIDEALDFLLDARGGLFGLDVVLILQGSHVFSTTVNIPSKQTKHIAQALPFMLEDNIGEDVEGLHFTPGDRDSEGNVGVLSIRKSVVEILVDEFDRAGLPLTAIIPDMLCLPANDSQWTFVTDGHQLITRTSQYQALSIELDALPILLNALFPEQEKDQEKDEDNSQIAAPDTLKVLVTQEFKSDNFENWLKTQITSHLVDIETELDLQHIESTEFVYLCDNLNSASLKQSNLLVGPYKPILKRAPSLFNWKPSAILLSIFMCLFVGFQYVQASKLEQQALQADSEAKALYKKYFPRDKRIFDVRKQMKSHLMNANTGGEGASFLPLLAQVGEKMNEMNRGKKTQVISPLRMSFDQVQGLLKIDCTAPGFNDLDNLKKKLETLQLSVEIARASQDGDKVKARVNVRSAS